MDFKHHNVVLYGFATAFLLVLMSCTMTLKPFDQGISQSNNIRTIERNGVLDDERKIWVVLQASGLSLEDMKAWRTNCISRTLKAAGLRNYEVADRNIDHFRSSDFENDYLLVVFLNNLKGTGTLSGGHGLGRHWLSLTASVYDFPQKTLVVRLGGSATAAGGMGIGNARDLCGSLLGDMIINMYSG